MLSAKSRVWGKVRFHHLPHYLTVILGMVRHYNHYNPPSMWVMVGIDGNGYHRNE